MTSYDDIWEAFVTNCLVDSQTLPQTNEGKYILIHNGLRHYNVLTDESETKLKSNDTLEQINVDLDDNRLLILAYCIRYTFLENELIGFKQVWQPFAKEVGQKFYREQINGREYTLESTQEKIDQLLLNIEPMSYLE